MLCNILFHILYSLKETYRQILLTIWSAFYFHASYGQSTVQVVNSRGLRKWRSNEMFCGSVNGHKGLQAWWYDRGSGLKVGGQVPGSRYSSHVSSQSTLQTKQNLHSPKYARVKSRLLKCQKINVKYRNVSCVMQCTFRNQKCFLLDILKNLHEKLLS